MQKIVRLELLIDGTQYVYDQSFDEAQTNQVNCDNAFKNIVTAVQENKPLAVTCPVVGVGSGERLVPTVINTANVKVICIDSAKVYDVKEQDGDIPPNDDGKGNKYDA